MTHFFANLSPIQRLFLSALIFAVVALAISFGSGGIPLGVLCLVLLAVVFWIARGIWLPPGAGATKVRLYSLYLIALVSAPAPIWAHYLNALLEQLKGAEEFVKLFPIIKHIPTVHHEPSYVVLGFVWLSVATVNFFLRDKTVAGVLPAEIDKEFPERGYKDRLKVFCAVLRRHIEDIDRDSKWSPEYYTPLDAEVTVFAGTKKRREVADLQDAIRHDKTSKAFLILGDPGAGKSVALRKLCVTMLDEVPRTGRVPLYINLREWRTPNKKWTTDRLPTAKDVGDFVVTHLTARGDAFFEEFIQLYLQKMIEHGRVFFVFDSFDEIPALLDEDEDSPIVEGVSDAINKYIVGAHGSRGIVSSRQFRRPTAKFTADKSLEVRPLSEERVFELMQKYPACSSELLERLLVSRPDLVPVARNPFTATLLGQWINEYSALPESQAILYAHHISGALNRSASFAVKQGIDLSTVGPACIEIATHTFSGDGGGFEIYIYELEAAIKEYPIRKIIDLLAHARLARKLPGTEESFTFVHRRFSEYFVAQAMMTGRLPADMSSIPRDSKLRDSMVMYVELTTEERAREIAAYCWQTIKTSFRKSELPADGIHCLRFVIDAFRTRKSSTSAFSAELAVWVLEALREKSHVLKGKFALEAAGLLSEREIESAVHFALKRDISWLGETALRACRSLARLPEDTLIGFCRFLNQMPPEQVLIRRSELKFSLRLSSVFKKVYYFWLIKSTFVLLEGISLIVLAVIAPKAAAVFALIVVFMVVFTEKKQREASVSAEIENAVAALCLVMLFGFPFIYGAELLDNQKGASLLSSLDAQQIALIYLFMFVWAGPRFLLMCWNMNSLSVGLPTIRDLAKELKELFGLVLSAAKRKLVLIPLGVLLVIPLLPSSEKDLVNQVLGGLVAGLFLLGMVLIAYDRLSSWIRDIRRISAIDFGFTSITREHIFKNLQSFESERAKVSFLEKLEATGIAPIGSWPDETIFQMDGKFLISKSKLAQLEERWLGLAR